MVLREREEAVEATGYGASAVAALTPLQSNDDRRMALFALDNDDDEDEGRRKEERVTDPVVGRLLLVCLAHSCALLAFRLVINRESHACGPELEGREKWGRGGKIILGAFDGGTMIITHTCHPLSGPQ
jgi:hypothetical protein